MSVYVKDPSDQAEACVIWMHGLGSNAQNMMGLAEQLQISSPIRHVFLDAPMRQVTVNNRLSMRAWYDIVGPTLTDREDREGILHSDQLIQSVIMQQIDEKFDPKQIFLAGFSQGGAMALFTGLHFQYPLAGIISLSAYLPLAVDDNDRYNDISVFMAMGTQDNIVLPEWTKQSQQLLLLRGLRKVVLQNYFMAHSVCLDEIRDISNWLSAGVNK